MRRLELMIEEARLASQNSRYDSDSGRSQAAFVRFFKNAQDAIVREVQNGKSKFFLREKRVTTVSHQEEYAYPHGIYMQNIDTLEFAENSRDFVPLTRAYTKDRMSQEVGFAFGYILREQGFLLTPPVTGGGTLRINFIRDPNRPQIRQGKIQSVTVSSGQVTAMTLDVSEGSFDAQAINKENYLCVVDRLGNQKAANILYDSIDAATGVISLTGHTLSDGESVSVGDYICVGENVTNKIELPDTCESFLILHATYQAKYGDSSQWTKETREDMAMHLAQLVTSFNRNSDDIAEIPITNADYLSLF